MVRDRGSKGMDGCPLTVIAGYKLEGLEAACMSGNVRIVVLLDNTMPQVSVFGDIDLTAEHE
jgi:hypothetical protein